MYGTQRSYSIGFLFSLALTVEAYLLVRGHTFPSDWTVVIVLALAIVQLLVQLFYFLHFDRAAKASWNIVAFLFMALVISIIVFGSLWIMQNLNYRMRSPSDTNTYIHRNEDL